MDWFFKDMVEAVNAFHVLSAMITPAVLISACGTLIFSTSTRLARVVDRVRELSRIIENLSSAEEIDFPEERHAEIGRQLSIHTRRSQYIQRSLTSFYISLGLFVGTTVAIGMISLFKFAVWLPNVLGIIGTVVLFYGCVMLIAETRLALRSVNLEMEFTHRLSEKYRLRRAMADSEAKTMRKGHS